MEQQFEAHTKAVALAINIWAKATGQELPQGLFERYSESLAELEPEMIIEAMQKAARGAWIEGQGNWPTARDIWRLAGGHPADRLQKARALVRDHADELLADSGPLYKRIRFGAHHEEALKPFLHLTAGLPSIKELIQIDTGGEEGRGREPWKRTAREIRGLIDFEQAAQVLAANWRENSPRIADHSPRAQKMDLLTQ